VGLFWSLSLIGNLYLNVDIWQDLTLSRIGTQSLFLENHALTFVFLYSHCNFYVNSHPSRYPNYRTKLDSYKFAQLENLKTLHGTLREGKWALCVHSSCLDTYIWMVPLWNGLNFLGYKNDRQNWKFIFLMLLNYY